MPSITLTFTAAEATRIAEAYGAPIVGPLPAVVTPATIDQVKAELVAGIKDRVRSYETRRARQNVTVPTDIAPT